jgi:purine-nucleoside phosphorylase
VTRFVAAVGEELGSVPGTVLGVGLVAAATSAARFLAREQPDRVVLVGTAGALPGGPPVGSVVVAGEIGLGCPATALGLGYIPRAPAPIACDDNLVQQSGLPSARVLTNLAITTDPELAARFSAAWQVEHMEAYAVAYACADAGIPFVAVLGIANQVGPNAHREWLQYRLVAGEMARTAALRLA